jgi:DNA-binding NarL/FixJ family response regulator
MTGATSPELVTRLDGIEAQLQMLLMRQLAARQPDQVGLWGPQLSPRETEMLTYLAAGLTSQEIADALIISERTVREHIAHILAQLQVPNRMTAITWALFGGLVATDDVIELWRRYRPHLVVE